MNHTTPSSFPKWVLPGLMVLAVAVIFASLVVQRRVEPSNANTQPSNANYTTPANTPSDITEWQLYTDSDARFSMRYPDVWTLDKRSSEGAIYLNPTRGVQEPLHFIQIIRGDRQAALEWMNRERTGSALRFELTSETMRINGNDVPIASDGTPAFRYALVTVSPYILVIWTFPPLEQNTYEKIVGTLSY